MCRSKARLAADDICVSPGEIESIVVWQSDLYLCSSIRSIVCSVGGFFSLTVSRMVFASCSFVWPGVCRRLFRSRSSLKVKISCANGFSGQQSFAAIVTHIKHLFLSRTFYRSIFDASLANCSSMFYNIVTDALCHRHHQSYFLRELITAYTLKLHCVAPNCATCIHATSCEIIEASCRF